MAQVTLITVLVVMTALLLPPWVSPENSAEGSELFESVAGIEPVVQVVGRADQAQVREGLREIAQVLTLQAQLPYCVNRAAVVSVNRRGNREETMNSKLINHTPKTYAIVFHAGDEVIEGMTEFANQHGLVSGQFTAIGAFEEVTVGFFNPEKRDYNKVIIREQVEVLSLVGGVTLKDGLPQVHAHVVVGKGDATAHGGHLLRATVHPTLEVVLVESPEHLHRRHDPTSGLALIDPAS